MRLLTLLLGILVVAGCKTGGGATETKSGPGGGATPPTPHSQVARKLDCPIQVANGLNPEARFDIFYFGDPASANAPVYWDAFADGDETPFRVLTHVAGDCPTCFVIEAKPLSGASAGEQWRFTFSESGGQTILDVEHKQPIGGPEDYIQFGLDSAVCRAPGPV